MGDDEDSLNLQARVDLLDGFVTRLKEWNSASVASHPGDSDKIEQRRSELESWVNRNALAVRRTVVDAGLGTVVAIGPPRALGGMVARIDVITEVFEDRFGRGVICEGIRLAEQAMGFYEHLRDNTGLVRLPRTPESLDVVDSIERALRPAFRSGPPSCEKDVQDQIEVILRAVGVDFTRDQEVAPVAARASKPDFVLPLLDVALEVKLANEKHSESKVQEEIMTDVSAYRTKWKRLVFVVYDTGVVHDPVKMRAENMKQFGVTILIVKH
jgi:REase_DpnII-MboI